MNKKQLTPLVCGLLSMIPVTVQAIEIQWAGYASIIGGMTVGDGGNGPQPNTFLADPPTNGVYDDYLTFKPETIFGLQGSVDLGNNLTFTVQFTGAGGEDFDTTMEWGYISYDASDNWNFKLGRQRIPLYLYSDYLDVAFAYHWVRPPVGLYGSSVDVFEGVNVTYQTLLGDDWETSFNVYAGRANNFSVTSNANNEFQNALGFVATTNYDWLTLRATYVIAEVATDNITRNGAPQGTRNPNGIAFAGVAANADFGAFFVGTEYAVFEFDDPVGPDQGVGLREGDDAYITAGVRIGSVTPHITFSTSTNTLDPETGFPSDQDVTAETISVGLRWDIHPRAAFKVQYDSVSDESDDLIKTITNEGEEVDLITFGIDLVF